MKWSLSLKEAPEQKPVSLEDMKLFLRVDGEDEDELIKSLITSATEYLEEFTNRAFVTQTWIQSVEAKPKKNIGLSDQFNTHQSKILLRKSPVKSVNSISIVNGDEEKPLDQDAYCVALRDTYTEITFKGGSPLSEGSLKIEFKAGYGNAEDVPSPIVTAIKQCVSNLYENRGDAANDASIPLAIKVMLEPYLVRSL